MRPQVFLVTLAVLTVLAALPLTSNGSGEDEAGTVAAADDAENWGSWPCCNQCWICTRKNPPDCQCRDISYQGCHPACRNCVKYTSAIEPPIYQCNDVITNFCNHRCTPTVAVI